MVVLFSNKTREKPRGPLTIREIWRERKKEDPSVWLKLLGTAARRQETEGTKKPLPCLRIKRNSTESNHVVQPHTKTLFYFSQNDQIPAVELYCSVFKICLIHLLTFKLQIRLCFLSSKYHQCSPMALTGNCCRLADKTQPQHFYDFACKFVYKKLTWTPSIRSVDWTCIHINNITLTLLLKIQMKTKKFVSLISVFKMFFLNWKNPSIGLRFEQVFKGRDLLYYWKHRNIIYWADASSQYLAIPIL